MVKTGAVRAALEQEPLLQRARDLQPLLRERALETEGLRRVPDENVQAILDSRLNLIGVPMRFGGLDVDFSLMHDIAFELGRACGATAWCYSLWAVHNWWVGHYSPEAQEEIYADGPDVLICSGGYSLHSSAEPVEGGYLLSGQWQFSSGCDHSSWAILHTPTADGSLGTLVPASDFAIQHDTWFVSGMQGTGSKDVVVCDAFVPAHRAVTAPAGMRVPLYEEGWSPREYHRQRRYGAHFGALIVWDLVAPAIGIAQGAIDEFSLRLRGSSGRPRAAVRVLGGTGMTHDWAISRRIVEAVECPVFLAGGLNSANVGEAIRRVRPFGVDLCTGVRTAGQLDPAKLEAFIAAIASA